MLGRKGYGSAFKLRVRARWTRLLLLTCILILLVHLSDWGVFDLFLSSFFPAPPSEPPYSPSSLDPSSVTDTGFSYDWARHIPKYPANDLAQLPRRKVKKPLKIQHDFRKNKVLSADKTIRKQRQAAVRATFQRCWGAYRKYAWREDELLPISSGRKTTFGGWGATLVDGLDTLWIMGMKAEFKEAVDAITQIDFTAKDREINMFETTIRYLGGLLAAYDLTNGKEKRLLDKATQLGDMIYASFDTPNRMPITRWYPIKAAQGEKQEAAEHGILAELASFSLEFTRLSQVTGDMRYYDAVERVAHVLSSQQMFTKIPGLFPIGVNVRDANLMTDNAFGLGTMVDSAYEYLPKTYQLLRGADSADEYKTMYSVAADAAIQYLLFRPKTPDNADILVPTSARVWTEETVEQDYTTQHLTCFTGGMFALGSRLLQNATHLEYGRKLTEACIWAYTHAPNGIMPENFLMLPCSTAASSFDRSNCTLTSDEVRRQPFPGFETVTDARYVLRPEAIESVFYMYRLTGEKRYQDVAWQMFQAIEKHTRTEYANAAIMDVTTDISDDGSEGVGSEKKKELIKVDSMESFWLAETLKYFYLIFSEPNLISLDEWVLNTEAHPFRLS